MRIICWLFGHDWSGSTISGERHCRRCPKSEPWDPREPTRGVCECGAESDVYPSEFLALLWGDEHYRKNHEQDGASPGDFIETVGVNDA